MPHTPGPWIRADLLVYALHHNGDYLGGKPLLVNRFSARVDDYVRQGAPPEEALANAFLIAAAPELLAALTGLIELGRKDTSNPKYDGYYEEARAALAKAKP